LQHWFCSRPGKLFPRCYRLCWLHSINLATRPSPPIELQTTSVSQQNGLQCPWQLTLWHHVVNSSVTGRRFSHGCLILIVKKRLSSTLMSLYQCVSFGPARRYLASVPGRQASYSSSLAWALAARYWHGPGAAGPAVLDVLDYVNAVLVVRGAGRILDGSTCGMVQRFKWHINLVRLY
jgi:hypothetical protein